MSVVVDSSVVVAALVDTGDNGTWAEKILAQDDLYAPELLRVESANVLRRLERGKEITEQEANAAFEELMELNVEFHEIFESGVCLLLSDFLTSRETSKHVC